MKNDFTLFDLTVDNNDLIDAVYFFIVDYCQEDYITAKEIALSLSREHGWDISSTHVHNAVKQIRETAIPRYAYEIGSAAGKGYKLFTSNKDIPATVKQLLGLVRNVLTTKPEYARLVYKEMYDTLSSSEGLSQGQQDFAGNIYRKEFHNGQ